MLLPIYLTGDEVRGITGRSKASAQIRWFMEHGFVVLPRADGTPLVSRAHFEGRMGAERSLGLEAAPEPDWGPFE